MAAISEQQAKEILEKNGYKVFEHLGEGAASCAFKASRMGKKGEKIVAAKVCCPQSGSWASLEDELTAAEELKNLKKDFKSKIQLAQQAGQTELVKSYQEASKYLFKYLSIPKFRKKIKNGDENCEIAIFEAPLADSSMASYNIGGGGYAAVTIESIPDPDYPDELSENILKANVDYSELKKAIRSILKGLKAIHDQGKFHGDIKAANILKKFDAEKGKYRYSITDFGTLKTTENKALFLIDLKSASQMFLCFWLACLDAGREIAERGLYSPGLRIGPYIDSLCRNGYVHVFISKRNYKPGMPRSGDYFLTDEDRNFLNFCKKLCDGVFKSADEALADSWLKKTN